MEFQIRVHFAVGPSLTDPIPGWIDNLFGISGLWAASIKGLLRTQYGIPARFDTVPVDIAIKTIVLASWSRALGIRIR